MTDNRPHTDFDEHDGPPEFEIPDFDPRRTRRAIRRGILRTSLVTAAILLVITLAATLGLRAPHLRGDREQRMRDVLGTALAIANPAYRIRLGAIEASPLTLSLEVGATPIRATGTFGTDAAFGDRREEIRQDLFGRVARVPLGHATETPLSYALYDLGTGNRPKERMRAVLARLPEAMNALVVVEFATPLDAPGLADFARRYGSCPELVVYERRPRATPITWGGRMTPSTSEPRSGACHELVPHELENFRRWTASLREHDDVNLRRFGLDLSRLRAAATAGKVYGYVDRTVSVAQVRKMLDDPSVATVRVVDVSFDLEL